MVWELCTSGGAIRKAGLNANTAITISAGALTAFYNDAEGGLIEQTRRDWVGGAGKTEAGVVKAIASVMECEIAKQIINYDPNAWTLATMKAKVAVLQATIDSNMRTLTQDEANDIRSVE